MTDTTESTAGGESAGRPAWRFPALPDPRVFVAAPGDLAYLREAVARELEDLRRSVADDHGVGLYDWQIDHAEDGFRDWIPPQGQIPLPSDPNCRAVICMLGERIGTPLSADFDTRPLGPMATLHSERAALVHPWRAGAEAEGGFSLTGTTFEYLAALYANRTSGAGDERGHPPVLLLIVGDETVRADLGPLDARWGGQRLFEAAEQRFHESHGVGWRSAHRAWEREDYIPQILQLRNFLRHLEDRNVFPRIVEDEERVRREVRAFLVRELDLRTGGTARDPFKGLQAYDREDNEVFFGREIERREAVAELTGLWEDATRPTFYGVIGGSGVGKSSLTRAGLVGHLCHQTSRGRYLACIMQPDDLLPDPLARLYTLALAQIDPHADPTRERQALDAVKEALQPAEAVHRLGEALERRGADWRLLLTFDQFEELLDRRGADDARRWEPLIDFIVAASMHRSMGIVYTLQTNRSELIAQDPKLGPLWARGGNLRLAFPVHSLDEIIRKPFAFAGITELEPELVHTLRDRIIGFAQQSDGESQGSLLPLVSLTLRRIFDAHARAVEETAPAQRRRLGLADCEGLLEVEGAIAELAEAAAREARSASGAEWSDATIDSLLRRLVRLSGGANDRLVLPEAPMPGAGAARRLALALMRRRLLLPESGGRIRLVHEAVLRHWPVAAQWLARERRLLRTAGIVGFKAEDWEAAGRADTTLAAHGQGDIDDAAELLSQWFDVLGADGGAALNATDARIRDYALALLRTHPTPRRAVPGSAAGSCHLHLAGFYGDLPLVQAHLATDPQSVDITRGDGRSALFGPSFAGDLAVLHALIEAGADVDRVDRDGWRPLHLAASAGRLAALDALLAAGASLALASEGTTASPLYLAASNGHGDTVARLLALGADPARPAGEGWTPLHAAAYDDHAGVIGLLVDAGAPTEARLQGNAMTPLHVAALHGRTAAVRALAVAGAALEATVDRERRRNWSALHMAVHAGHRDAALALLHAGASADVRDDIGQTPLYLALMKNNHAMATALLEGGAPIDAPARDARTCLYLAVSHGDDVQARWLLQHGANPATAADDGRAPLHLAALEGKDALLRMLLDAGADPLQIDAAGANALHHAARAGHAGTVQALLALPQVAIDAVDDDGLGALHRAAEAGRAEVVTLLLARSAPVGARDRDGWTPLHLAALAGHTAVARQLIAAGAEVDAVATLPAARPLHVAAELGHVELIQLLIEAGADREGITAHKPAPLELALRYRHHHAAQVLAGTRASIGSQGAQPPGLPGAPGASSLSGRFNARSTETSTPEIGAGIGASRWRPAPADAAALALTDPELAAAGTQHGASGVRIDAADLPWYPGARLLRVRDDGWMRPRLAFYFVLAADRRLFRLAGTSEPLHDLNEGVPLVLDAADVPGYLKFFCFFVRSDEGPFYLVEQADDPLLPADLDEATRDVLRAAVRPVTHEGRDDGGRHLCDAVVWYGSALFAARFAITDSGDIELLNDEPIADLRARVDAPIA